MSYVTKHLLPGERVVYRAHLHWIIFGGAVVLAILAVAAAVLLWYWPRPRYQYWWGPAAALGALALLAAIGPWIRRTSSEFAVTDKRVLIKVGFIGRDSLETLLSKIEAIGVDQHLWARVFNYGTITVIGTGGTHEAFPLIAAPMEFRRQVQAQIVALDSARAAAPAVAAPAGGPALSAPREERDCPYCAERILARAKVCRYCGRDVEPLVS